MTLTFLGLGDPTLSVFLDSSLLNTSSTQNTWFQQSLIAKFTLKSMKTAAAQSLLQGQTTNVVAGQHLRLSQLPQDSCSVPQQTSPLLRAADAFRYTVQGMGPAGPLLATPTVPESNLALGAPAFSNAAPAASTQLCQGSVCQDIGLVGNNVAAAVDGNSASTPPSFLSAPSAVSSVTVAGDAAYLFALFPSKLFLYSGSCQCSKSYAAMEASTAVTATRCSAWPRCLRRSAQLHSALLFFLFSFLAWFPPATLRR